MCRGRINLIQKVYASHNVVIKNKPEQKNDENAWPEDAEDDEEEDEKQGSVDKDKAANAQDVTIRIAPASVEKKQGHDDIFNVVLELTGSEKRGRCPVDICAVLDVSGSMCSSAAVQEDDGSVSNDDGLSRLDCVKHSIKTVINCLSKKDRFSIVSFESKAKLEYKLDYMTKKGMQQATNAVERLNAAGQTNLWDGLRQGLESLRTNHDKSGKRLSVIMLLTDGCPTMIPPKGHLHELTNYMDEHNFSVQINTFGFGYDLDSDLMHSLAVAGHGTFAFIPDARIVGTTFVNSVSNVLTTIFPTTKLSLTPMNGSRFVGQSYGAYSEQDESWGRAIEIGPIMGGAPRYISVPMAISDNPQQPYLELQLSTAENKVVQTVRATKREISGELLAGHLTAKVVTVGFKATELAKKRKGNAAIQLLAGLKKEVKGAAEVASKMETDNFDQMTANSRMEALDKDVQGRFAKAFNGEARFNRWGKHYLRALLRAHQLNMCTNFMDPGLQVNGGNLFRSLRAKGDEVFINLPAPKPSRRVGGSRNYYQASSQPQQRKKQAQPKPQPPPPQPDMSSYYAGASGGCFAPFCTVNVLDTVSKQIVSKQVCQIRPGDQVQVVGHGNQKMNFATVLFAVELSRNANRRMIRFPTGLVITGGHPVRRNGVWCVPRQQKDVEHAQGCHRVFAFVLDKVHIMIVNGMECITWAHNLRHVAVQHSVFGSNQILQDLKQRQRNLVSNIVAVHQ